MMTPNDAALTVIVELRQQMYQADLELQAARAENGELRATVAERDKTIAELHEHITDLERLKPKARNGR